MSNYKDPEGLDIMGFKFCRTCGQWKPRENFHNNYRNKDHKTPKCKDCVLEYARSEAGRKLNTKRQLRWKKAHSCDWAAYMRQHRKQPMAAWKNKIRTETKQLILQGLILHPGCCEECGVVADHETTIHIHHLTYVRPDKVKFLCQTCHSEWHRNNLAPPEPSKQFVDNWYETYQSYPEEDQWT